MGHASNRPLSPHLQVYKWGPHMAVSIFHRITGFGLATLGALMLVWWLYAISAGAEPYAQFIDCLMADEGNAVQVAGFNVAPFIILFGLSWAFFQHLFSGLRHLVLDTGAGYELTGNRTWSIIVFVAAIAATVALWASIFASLVEG